MQGSLYTVRIDKGKFTEQLNQSQAYRAEITVKNDSQREVQVKVYLEDFEYVAPFDGTKEFYPPGSTNNSLAGWMTFSPQDLTIPPYSNRQVSFTITPKEPVNTTHCGVLFFESPLGMAKEGTGLSLVGRVGSLIFIHPQNKQKEAVFEDILGNLYQIKGKFQNTGNTLLTPKGTYYIMDTQGMVIDRGELPELYLLPGNTTYVEIDIPKEISPGRYTAVLTFDLEEGDVLVKEIDFSTERLGDVKILQVRD